MNVLSLFDGMSCGMIALERAGIKVGKYYASEIDKYATKVSEANYPDIVRLGDVTKWREWPIDWSAVDLLIGGSPCQGFSMAGEHGGTKATLNGMEFVVTCREMYQWAKEAGAEFASQSHLFWEYVMCLDHIKAANPRVKFLLENVKMARANLDLLSEALGVEPVRINSNLVSAQNRDRFYWCNWGVEQPEDRGAKLIDILEPDVCRAFYHSGKAIAYMNRCVADGRSHWDFGHHSDADNDKSAPVTANFHKGVPYNCLVLSEKALARLRRKNYSAPRMNPEKTGALNQKNNSGQLSFDSGTTLVSSGDGRAGCIRRLSPLECERLQTVPDNYTDAVSNTQRYRMLGNGWTVDVIAHIFNCMVDNHKLTDYI